MSELATVCRITHPTPLLLIESGRFKNAKKTWLVSCCWRLKRSWEKNPRKKLMAFSENCVLFLRCGTFSQRRLLQCRLRSCLLSDKPAEGKTPNKVCRTLSISYGILRGCSLSKVMCFQFQQSCLIDRFAPGCVEKNNLVRDGNNPPLFPRTTELPLPDCLNTMLTCITKHSTQRARWNCKLAPLLQRRRLDLNHKSRLV